MAFGTTRFSVYYEIQTIVLSEAHQNAEQTSS